MVTIYRVVVEIGRREHPIVCAEERFTIREAAINFQEQTLRSLLVFSGSQVDGLYSMCTEEMVRAINDKFSNISLRSYVTETHPV